MISAKFRKIRKFCSGRVFSVVLLTVLCVTALWVSVLWQFKTVTVSADGKTFTVVTSAKSAETVLKNHGITLSLGDEFSLSEGTELADRSVISVKRAFPLKLTIGNDNFTINTFSKPLSQVLESEGIALYEHDTVSPSPDTVITPDSEIVITRISVSEIRSHEAIPYTVKFRPNAEMERGDSKITTQGEDGEREALYRITTTNGVETDRVLVSEKVTKQPATQIIEYGSNPKNPLTHKTKPETAQVLANCSYIDCKAYSYILYGATATGVGTKRGVIAVDPRIIPLGSKVYVQSLDGKPDYGFAVAGDTGGAIKGNVIDMWVPTYAEAAQNGVRKMRVYILPQ